MFHQGRICVFDEESHGSTVDPVLLFLVVGEDITKCHQHCKLLLNKNFRLMYHYITNAQLSSQRLCQENYNVKNSVLPHKKI